MSPTSFPTLSGCMVTLSETVEAMVDSDSAEVLREKVKVDKEEAALGSIVSEDREPILVGVMVIFLISCGQHVTRVV